MAATLAVRIIIVADLAQSVNFYRTVFGFEPMETFEAEDPALDAMTQLRDVRLRAQLMRNQEGITIELAQFLQPAGFGSRESNNVAHYGLTHLAFVVDDIDAVRTRVIAAGGKALDHTRVKVDTADVKMAAMFVADPNGVRIEIAVMPGAPACFMWNGICVRDLKRSIDFYRTFGFEPAETFDLRTAAPWLSTLNDVDGIRLFVQVIRDAQGNALELLDILEPTPAVEEIPRVYNRFGLANLAFFVDDRDTVAAQLRARGGKMFDAARVDICVNGNKMKQWHGIDPDGVRIELVQHSTAEMEEAIP